MKRLYASMSNEGMALPKTHLNLLEPT